MKYCPVCSSFIESFSPYNARPNALCPECNSFERHRLAYMYFIENTSLFKKSAKLLHFAPEKCFADKISKFDTIDYLTVDLKSPLAMKKVDIQNMDFEDAHFDAVYCSHVLEHVPDDSKAIGELYRVLKPGGYALIMVPINLKSATTLEDPSINTPEQRTKYYKQFDHVRYYGLDFKDRLSAVGFDVRVEDYASSFDSKYRSMYGLHTTYDLIYFCNK